MIYKPTQFPHHYPYYYTRRGFKRIRRRLARLYGFTKRDLERLESLYFNEGDSEHQNEAGTYVNKRKYRLHKLSRELSYDRKTPTFRLVERSGLFYILYDEDGHIEAFESPRMASFKGIISLDRYARSEGKRIREKGKI